MTPSASAASAWRFDEGSTVADLKHRLGVEYPNVEPMLETVVCAIDDDYVTIRRGAARRRRGGADPARQRRRGRNVPALYRLTHEVMQPQGLVELVQRDEAGAVALFYGNVRNHSEGRDVERLEYEAHETHGRRQDARSSRGDEAPLP